MNEGCWQVQFKALLTQVVTNTCGDSFFYFFDRIDKIDRIKRRLCRLAYTWRRSRLYTIL